MEKTNIGLVEYAKAQLGKEYWYGTYGSAASESLHKAKKKQYPKYYTWKYQSKWAGMKVHDCVGLIKGYLWSQSPTDTKPKYNKNQDVSANGMKSKCKVKGKISTMPDVAGVLVFFDGHVGVYEGNGYVIEARGHAYGVVRTKLNSRPWKEWGYCPWISYGAAAQPETAVKPVEESTISITLKVLKYGSENEQVKTLQRLLTSLGYGLGKVDGEFGSKTQTAVEKFQKAKGLEVDGIVGKNTWKKLLGA